MEHDKKLKLKVSDDEESDDSLKTRTIKMKGQHGEKYINYL